MNELNMIFVILVTLAVSYLWVYPTFAGNDIKRLHLYDIGLTAIPIAIAGAFFWVSDPPFSLIFFETNWFVFTIVSYVILELPLSFWYLKARGISQAYWDSFRIAPKGSPDAAWAAASVKSVEKQLSDSKWDGLRTRGAKRFLLIGTNVVILFGTGFLIAVGDNALASYALIHILLLGVFYFLLRQSVRLVADAPEEALDERLIRIRDRSYLVAYRWFGALAVVLASALMVFAIRSDAQPDSDGFNYVLSFTWPQAQAVFWLVIGYALMLPSLAMISQELSRKSKV
jgi:hypothetical protein